MALHIYLLFGVVLLLVIVISLRFEYGVVPNPSQTKEMTIVSPSNERIVKRLNNGRIVFEEKTRWQITDLDSLNSGDDHYATEGPAWTLVQKGIRQWEAGEKSQALSLSETVACAQNRTLPEYMRIVLPCIPSLPWSKRKDPSRATLTAKLQ